MPPHLLLSIPQSPLDMASGAAASERTTCEMLARAGWCVRVVATTASESFQSIDHTILLREKDISFHRETLRRSGGNVLAFTYRGVNYRLLDTGAIELNEARRTRERDLDELIAEELEAGPPAILLTYGSSEAEVRRRTRAREKGVRVVFSVRNFAYLHPRAFESVDAIISPSRYISDYYRQHLGVEVTPMPLPISIDDVVAPFNSPTFVTLINPAPQKGVLFFLRIVEQGLKRWPNLQFLTVESRGSGHTLSEAAAMLGLDLRGLKNLYVAKATANPSSIYALTRILLVPSLMEPAGRVAVEAQLNRIPVLASDRGGLPETVGSGGFVLPILDDVRKSAVYPEVENWLDLVGRLHNDAIFYAESSRAAFEATSRYRSGEIERRRVEYFRLLLRERGES